MIKNRMAIFGALVAGTVSFGPLPASAQQVFATPDAAAKALVEAARSPHAGMLDEIFGAGGQDLIASGDPDVDKQRITDFLDLANRGTGIADGHDGEKLLVFGSDQWSFPVPLKKTDAGWQFDLAAGKQEVIDRAIGRNELLAIAACADYVAAQEEYFASLHDDEPVQQYAQKFLSTPGLHDGLFWEPDDQGDRSPLGDRIAVESIKTSDAEGAPRSYHGYFFRILTRQGPSAPGGAYSYMVNGRLLAGFGMAAYPEKWGETGVMTFLCDQRGNIYERNLGPNTGEIGSTLKTLNPTAEWDDVPE